METAEKIEVISKLVLQLRDIARDELLAGRSFEDPLDQILYACSLLAEERDGDLSYRRDLKEMTRAANQLPS